MQVLNSEKQIQSLIECPGKKLLYIYSPGCPACEDTADILSQCSITMELLLDKSAKIEITKCREYCEQNEIVGVPHLILYGDDSKELSRINFVPSQDDFLLWLSTLVD